MSNSDFINDYLDTLKVHHTRWYSSASFDNMSFKSLFGLKCLLKEYGIDSYALKDVDLEDAPTPFVAPLKNGDWVIVTNSSGGKVSYRSMGEDELVDKELFESAWTGIIFVSEINKNSIEPDYRKHRFIDLMRDLRDIGIAVLITALILYGAIYNGLFEHATTILVLLFNSVGLGASIMLEQKSMGIHTRLAAHVCGIIEKDGCDDVLASDGSKFLGIFHWSDVGLGYFGMSIILLIAFPHSLPYVALYNAMCLPYSFWSVGYQHFKAHAWCTLCLTVQATLWILAGLYLLSCGHWWKELSISEPLLYLVPAMYVLTVLSINKLMACFNGKRSE